MKSFSIYSARSLTLLLVIASVSLANGHVEANSMDMSGGGMDQAEAARPVISTTSNSTNIGLPSYFRHQEYSGLMLAHIVLMSVGWIFVLPLGVMLSISQSRLSLPVQFAFIVINGFGTLLATVYNANTPDLYPNNAHHKLGWLLIWTICAQTCMALINTYTRRSDSCGDRCERVAFIPVSMEAMAEHQRIQNLRDDVHRFSNDSGHGTESNTESSRSHSLSSLSEDRESRNSSHNREPEHRDLNREKPLKDMNALNKFLLWKLPLLMSSRTRVILSAVYETINRLILLLGFVALTSGLVTYAGIYRGSHIFSGLAHFIKGGVFFWYGILTLGRWAGCFADLGWAWNIKPPRNVVGHRKASSPSAEFLESFLIFFYGTTNVFLEHLAAWGSAWSAQDLEHVSITIMFFGGGLCGMLVESRKIRDMLNATIINSAPGSIDNPYRLETNEPAAWRPPKSYGFSMNPLPPLIVLLLGLMMSSHHQESMVSTMVHKQWGTLLVGAAFARAVTYILFYISPPTSLLPSRPPSELITAFCLMAGGLIFMASSVDTVAAMEFNELGAMFVFTITMGLVTFLMAWIILVIAIKGWAMRREGRSSAFSPTAA